MPPEVEGGRLFRWRDAIQSERGPASSTTRHVLLSLSTFMDEDGSGAFPSVRALVRATALSNRSILDHLDRARTEGWLEWTDEAGEGRAWRRRVYRPAIPPAAPAAEPEAQSFPSPRFVDLVRELFWLGDEPPAKAPPGWNVSIDLKDLKVAWSNLGEDADRLELVMRGFRKLADRGDLPGVEAHEGFTGGLLKRLRGAGYWDRAEAAARERAAPEPSEVREGAMLTELTAGIGHG